MSISADSEFSAGISFWEKGDVANAMRHFKAASAIDSEDSRYWVWYGVCLMKLHHWGEAVRVLERGVDLKPAYGEADARLMLAQALENHGDKNGAVAQLRIVVAMEPMYPSYDAPIDEAKTLLEKFT